MNNVEIMKRIVKKRLSLKNIKIKIVFSEDGK